MDERHRESESGLTRRNALKALGAVALTSSVAAIPAARGEAAGGFNQMYLDSLVKRADGGLLRVVAAARQGTSDSGNIAAGVPNTGRTGGVGWGETKIDTVKGPNQEPDWMETHFSVDSATTSGNVITMAGHVYRARNPVNAGTPLQIIVTRGTGDVAAVEVHWLGERMTGYGPLFQSSP